MKRILFITLLCAIAGTASAQIDFTIGAKAGANFAKFYNNQDVGLLFRPAYHLGLFGNVKLTDKMAFQPEVLYSAQGTKIANDLDNSDLENRRIRSGYLQVPLMLQYALTEKFTVEAGPQIGMLLSSQLRWDGYWEEDFIEEEGYTYYPEPDSQDTKEYYNTMDVGIGFGIGYKISKNIALYTRFTQGLTNIIKSSYLDPGEKEGNQVVAVGLSFSF